MSFSPAQLLLILFCGVLACTPQPVQTPVQTSKSKLVLWHKDIRKGDEAEFRALVSPGDTVSFNSRGGYVLTAMAFAQHMRNNRVRAVVSAGARCNSACGLALMGAASLSIDPTARIGVHRFEPVRPGSKEGLIIFVTDFGTPASYADTIWQIPHDKTRDLTGAERAYFYPRLNYN